MGGLTAPRHHLSLLQALLSWLWGLEAVQDFWRIEMGRGGVEAWKARSFFLSGRFCLDQAVWLQDSWPPTGWARIRDPSGLFCRVFEVFLLVELAGTT